MIKLTISSMGIAALVSISTPSFAVSETPTPLPYTISVGSGKVTIRAVNADLEEVVRELSRRAGFQIYIYEPLDNKVTITVEDRPMEEALRKLVPGYGFLFRRLPGGEARLKSVAILPGRPGGVRGYRKVPLVRLNYGPGAEELGRIDRPEAERRGPRSFAVDVAGNIYICDTVNRRVSIFDSEGNFKRTLDEVGFPADIAVSGTGDIFILDEEGSRIIRYPSDGRPPADIPLSPPLLAQLGNLEASPDGKPVLVTRDQSRYDLLFPDPGSSDPSGVEGPFPGTEIASGTSCLVRKISSDRGEVIITGPEGKVEDRIPLPVDRLASIAFLGSDRENNLYLQIEQLRPAGNGIALGVIKLNPGGIILDRIEGIPAGYASWTARLLQINQAGDIFQMMPGPDAVELNRWSRAANDAAPNSAPAGAADGSSSPPTGPASGKTE